MKPPPLRYLAPTSLAEVHAALAEYGDDAQVLAGGQSLVALLNLRLAAPGVLVDVRRVPELHTIAQGDGDVRIGAAVTQAQLEDHEALASLPLLAEMLPHLAHREIRNAGTVVGSLAHADPAAELPTAAVTLDADMVVSSASGSRVVPARELYEGYLMTCLAPDEVITEVRFPSATAGSVSSFREVAPRQGDYAVAGVALHLDLDDGRVRAGAVGLLALGSTPLWVDLEGMGLVGEPVAHLPADAVVDEVLGCVEPKGDVHADAGYRTYLAGVLTRRVLETAVGGVG